MSHSTRLAKLSKRQLKAKYVEYNIAARLAMESLDVALHNEYMDRILEIDAELIRRGGQAWKVLAPLLEHRDPEVRLSAACFLLRFDVESAVPVLQALTKIAHQEISFNAGMTLKLWEKGEFPLRDKPDA
ncbi:MAG TPA: DUF2019 domain-containing protein [Alphaproteobacteria bacterium]|nr:DUF2019 domain-containing protein [Alphaproteobacteria bacterium]